jgi:uncharacterized protein YjbI with pentapeptide repeats
MADDSDVDWETCDEDECVGVPLPSGGRCWAHAGADDRDAALDRLGEGGRLDGRGVTFTAELLQRLLDATPHDDEGQALLSGALFTQATFTGDASFTGATFGGYVEFDNATVAGNASFVAATFKGVVSFSEATFAGEALFSQATFRRLATFMDTFFKVGADFGGVTFEGDATFNRATFGDDVRFFEATFGDDVSFTDVRCAGDAWFHTVTFDRARQLGPMVVRRMLILDSAIVRERIKIEISAAALTCRRVRFLAGVQLRVRWAQVVLDEADLAAQSVLTYASPFLGHDEGEWPPPPDSAWGVLLAEADRREADLAAQSIVSISYPGEEGEWLPPPGSAWAVDAYGTPRLLSVRGADVAGLTVAAVDLRACRFVDAHHLDQLRAEGSNFANTPRGWRWTKRRTIAEEHQWRASNTPRGWRWTKRRTIAEEHQSRASEGDQGWYGPENQPPPNGLAPFDRTPLEVRLLVPGEIARLYREVRKGLEDSKDEPGAADFYYGEMEMRRHDKRQQVRRKRTLPIRNGESVATIDDGTSSTDPGSNTETGDLKPGRFGSSAAAEYAILTLYWLVSGYGLRAWRALASLTAVALVASVIYAFWGFDRTAGLDELPSALLFSTQATTALLRGPDPRALTTVGEWLLIALRLIGPVLLGLAVLSVRGRVKR